MTLNARIDLRRPRGFHLDVDLEIPGSGITVLFGPSGSGKTTILRCLAGLERGSAGDLIRVDLRGDAWQDRGRFTRPHLRGVGYVFQEAQLLPHLTVEGNLAYASTRRRKSGGPPTDQVVEWLGLAPLLAHRTAQLSGGEIQRTAIARALVSGSNLILMDEPLGALDRTSRYRILPYLDSIHQELAIPVVYVTHLLEELTYLADHVIMLDGGRVVAEGSVMQLTSRLDLTISHEERAGAILDCVLADHDDDYGLSRLSFDGGELFVTRRAESLGSHIRVRVPARDISIALDAPARTSILNIIRTRVDAVESSTETRALVRLAAGSQYLLARVTRKSAERLALRPGLEVFAQIKSVALLTELDDE